MATSILIVKLSSMGDVVHTLPAAQAIRAAHPNAHLAWAVERAHAEVLARQPWLDETIVWDRRTTRTLLDFLRRLRSRRWDIAIDFQGLLRSGAVTWLCGARRRIGYSPSNEKAHWFYNERVPLETMERHAVERSALLARQLGATCDELPLPRHYLVDEAPRRSMAGPRLFPLHPSDEDRAAVDGWLAEHRFDPQHQRLVILNPHCRKDANRWPAPRYAALAKRLLALPGVRVALSGGGVARALCDEIATPFGGSVWRADGRFGLLGSAELFRRASTVVTGDTGPMHLAVAVGAPVVALFGPANSLRTGPYASDAIVLDQRLQCAPCYARQCPLNYDPPRCLELISVESVLQAVLEQFALREAPDAPTAARRRSA